MPDLDLDGLRLHYRLVGEGGAPLVLVHGGWVSHRSWERVVPALSRFLRVLTYDRRGHSSSERQPGATTVRGHADDLEKLIERLGLAPAWIGGVSSGAAIALGLAARRPDLVQGLVLHEPALLHLVADDPDGAAFLTELLIRARAVVERIEAGDHAGAARQFVETIAEGPGAWDLYPEDYRQVLIGNAPTFVDDMKAPDRTEFELDRVRDLDRPVLLTRGEHSPPIFRAVVQKLAGAIAASEARTLPDVGHIPHRTHPELFVEVVTDFIGRKGQAALEG